MKFKNPFPSTVHEVFKYTFLQGVELDVNAMGKSDLNEYWERFTHFAKDEFGLVIPKKPLPDNSAITSKDIDTRFIFNYNTSSAFIRLGHKGYTSFETTMLKRVDTLLKYFRDVAEVYSVRKIMFRKRNVFPFYYKGTLRVNEILEYVFSSKEISKIDETEEKLVKSTKEKKIPLAKDANLLFTVGYSVKDEGNIDLFLDLLTEYMPAEGIMLSDFVGNLTELNGIMYDAYMSLVTDNVIKAMEEGLKK